MTLDPVFRGRRAVLELEQGGYLARLGASMAEQAEAIRYVGQVLPDILDKRYLEVTTEPQDEVGFLQRNFFLVLFHSILSSIGCTGDRLRFYTRLNLCIKGLVTSGDNLFDGEAKRLLPLRLGSSGSRFESIVQLLCFDRLVSRVCADALHAGCLSAEESASVQRELLNRLTEIGTLEGSEEDGVREVLPIEEMVEKVHRVRGGALFALAFVAPLAIERGEVLERVRKADDATRDLGTAFQIVDDLTDFEIDLRQGKHNLIAAYAMHRGDDRSRAAMEELLRGQGEPGTALLGPLRPAATQVLARAQEEGRRAFEKLAALGFWFPVERSDSLVRSIVGMEGVERIEAVAKDLRA